MRRSLFAIFCLLACAHSRAGFDTGNRLYEDCKSENYYNRGYCGGYIVGIVDTIEAMQASRLLPKRALCIPEGTTKGQIADVILKYLADNPGRRHLDSGSLVPEALNKAFPCA